MRRVTARSRLIGAWTDARRKPRSDKRLQRLVVDAPQWQLSDERVQCCQRARVPFETSLVWVFFQVLGRGLAERVLLTRSKKPCGPLRLQTAHQERFGFFEIACASAFANARAVDEFVDVPDTGSKDEAWHASTVSSHS